MNQTDANINKVQSLELEILLDFRRVCDLLNLKYFLFGGTLLGAIRGLGFIPWDDDIDVCMPRTDYEMFMKSGPSLINSKFRVENIFSMPDNDFPYCKIKYIGKKIDCKENQRMRVNHEIWIDIFPIDNICDSLVKQKSAIKKFQRRSFILCSKCNDIGNSFVKRVIKKTIAFLYPVTKGRLKKLLDTQFLKYNSDKTLNHCVSACLVFKAEDFSSFCLKKFEGYDFKVPTNYDGVLTHVYGDYMKLPPIEERVNKHKVTLI
jgi:lipopolysaccharide cholinephosphotransferase